MATNKRERFLKQSERKVRDAGKQLDQLKRGVEPDPREGPAGANLDRAQEKLDEAWDALQQLGDSGEDVWEDVKTGFEGAWNDLAAMMYSISSKIRLP